MPKLSWLLDDAFSFTRSNGMATSIVLGHEKGFNPHLASSLYRFVIFTDVWSEADLLNWRDEKQTIQKPSICVGRLWEVCGDINKCDGIGSENPSEGQSPNWGCRDMVEYVGCHSGQAWRANHRWRRRVLAGVLHVQRGVAVIAARLLARC